MKRALWIVGLTLSLVSSCNWDEGQCWSRSEEDGQVGAGGGPIVPGGGGYGDAPVPKPLAAGDSPPLPECLQVPPGACYQMCLASYGAATTQCNRIEDEAQRKVCQTSAYTAYMACWNGCKQAEDCKKCKLQCDAEHDKCHAKCKTSDCHAQCNDEYGKCLKGCGDCPH